MPNRKLSSVNTVLQITLAFIQFMITNSQKLRMRNSGFQSLNAVKLPYLCLEVQQMICIFREWQSIPMLS